MRKMIRNLCMLAAAAVVLLAAGEVLAVKYIGKKAFIKKHIPAGSTMSKSTVDLTAEMKKLLKTKWHWGEDAHNLTYILGRDDAGKLTGAVYFTTVYVTEHKCVHHLAVALGPEGEVRELAVTELFCERAMPVTAQSFLGQFNRKAAGLLRLNQDVSSITGATLSCQALVDVANGAAGGYTEFVRK